LAALGPLPALHDRDTNTSLPRPQGDAITGIFGCRCPSRRFRLGRQEDSHEYLRCLLDAMHEVCLKPFKPKPPPDLAATTVINRIFGGKLRSRVRPPRAG
jgi:hypothetical protein